MPPGSEHERIAMSLRPAAQSYRRELPASWRSVVRNTREHFEEGT